MSKRQTLSLQPVQPDRADWRTDFADKTPLFEPLRSWLSAFAALPDWPGLDDYQRLLDRQPAPILTHSGRPLKIVPQDARPQQFEAHYAPRLYLTGELQTRTQNWHDFFQFLTWLLFPTTKAVINALHVPLARARLATGEVGRRAPLENMLSLFDEGGAVILVSDESLLELIRAFRWKELFWTRRAELARSLRCITFGHAVYEKALQPYVGMTANAMLLQVDQAQLELPLPALLSQLDTQLAALLSAGARYTEPKALQPWPILGMPGWDPDNACEQYYDNVRYFRPGRGQATVK